MAVSRASLAGYFALNERAGRRYNLLDFQPSEISLTDLNTVAYLDDTTIAGFSGCASFNVANSEALYCAGSGQLRINNGDFTVGGWVYIGSTAVDTALVVKYGAGSPVGATNEFALFANAAATGKAKGFIGDATTVTSSVSNTANTWTFMTLKRTGGNITLRVGATNTTASDGGITVVGGTSEFMIGNYGSHLVPLGNATLRAMGVFIFNRALSEAEIDYMYNSGAGRADPFLPEPGASTFFGVASTPSDNGAQAGPAVTVTPPANMVAGDLVVMFAQIRHKGDSAVMRITTAGGQDWSEAPNQAADDGSGYVPVTVSSRWFQCTYDGTWTADPVVTSLAGTEAMTVTMGVWRAANASTFDFWRMDFFAAYAPFTAPGGGHTVTIPGCRNTRPGAVTIAAWMSDGIDTYGTLAGTGWTKAGLSAQYRNTTGSDQSMSIAYFLGAPIYSTPDVSQNQSVGSAGVYWIMSFSPVDRPEGGTGTTLSKIQSKFSNVASAGLGLPDITLYQFSCTFDAPVTSPNAVFGTINNETNASCKVMSITDNKGNLYTPIQCVGSSVFTQSLINFYCPGITNGPTTVYVTLIGGNGDPVGLEISEIAGSVTLDQYSAADGDQTGGGSGTWIQNPGAITTTANGDYIFANYRVVGVADNIAGFYSAASWGGTLFDQVGDAIGVIAARASADKVQTSAGAITASATMAADRSWMSQVVALRLLTSVPDAPTIGTAVATGGTTANVPFTAPAWNGGLTIDKYRATSTPGGLTIELSQAGSGTIAFTGLTANTSYTFTVAAHNSAGYGAESSASNSITTDPPPPSVTGAAQTARSRLFRNRPR